MKQKMLILLMIVIMVVPVMAATPIVISEAETLRQQVAQQAEIITRLKNMVGELQEPQSPKTAAQMNGIQKWGDKLTLRVTKLEKDLAGFEKDFADIQKLVETALVHLEQQNEILKAMPKTDTGERGSIEIDILPTTLNTLEIRPQGTISEGSQLTPSPK